MFTSFIILDPLTYVHIMLVFQHSSFFHFFLSMLVPFTSVTACYFFILPACCFLFLPLQLVSTFYVLRYMLFPFSSFTTCHFLPLLFPSQHVSSFFFLQNISVPFNSFKHVNSFHMHPLQHVSSCNLLDKAAYSIYVLSDFWLLSNYLTLSRKNSSGRHPRTEVRLSIC